MRISLMKKKKVNGDYSLYLEIYHKGKKTYEFLGIYLTKDKELNKEALKLAESIRAKRLIEIQNYNYGFVPNFKQKANFITYVESVKKRKPSRSEAYHNILVHLNSFTNGYLEVSSIDETWLEKFKEYLLSQVSQNSASTYFILIKSLLKQAVKDKLIIRNPGTNVPGIQLKDVQRTFLVIEEIQKLAVTECPILEVKKAFLFSCFTGLRFSDVKKLTWQEIKGNQIDFRQKKTQSVEYLPMPMTAIEILKEKKGNLIPFPTTKVFEIPERSHTNVILKLWAKAAELGKPISFHTARHTFATLSLTEGTDLYTVSKLLGHKNISTTQKYAKIIDKKKQEAIDRLPVIKITWMYKANK